VSTEIRDTFAAWQSKLLKFWKDFTIDAIRSSYYACCSHENFGICRQTAGIVELSTLLLLPSVFAVLMWYRRRSQC